MKNKLFLSVVFIVVANVVAFAGWYIMFNEVRGLTSDIQKGREALKRNERLEEDKRNSEILVSELGDKIKFLNSVFISDDSMVPFIENIEELARNTQNSVEISLGQIDKESKRPTLNVKVGGSLSNVYRFINALEYTKYKVEVSSFDIRQEESGSLWSGKVNLIILSYI